MIWDSSPRRGQGSIFQNRCCKLPKPSAARCIPKIGFDLRDGLVCNARRVMSFFDKLKFTEDELIPAIIQEASTGRVLMMAWMNRASLESTIKTGKTHFWSRSRKEYWMKGQSSGHVQHVRDVAYDCDGDTLLIQVEQVGAACHEGYQSCFFRSVEADGQSARTTEERLKTAEEIYGKKTP